MANPIYIMTLPCSGLMPLANGPTQPNGNGTSRKTYVPITILPETEEEKDALSAWVNTHQSMFMTVGAASAALTGALTSIDNANLEGAIQYLQIAQHLRLASAVYTYLPTVGPEVYERFLRQAMKRVRPGFSGVSSREAIAFGSLLKRVREASPPPDSSLEKFTQAKQGCLDADDFWWKMHSNAMHRMVKLPVSLAQHEFRRSVKEEGLEKSYSEYLTTTLQVPESLDDYDRFFGCQRGSITTQEYVTNLEQSLSLSDQYITTETPFSTYRKMLLEQVSRLLSQEV